VPLLSQRAYARHRAELGLPGTTHRAVQKKLQRGCITANADGLIDSDAADAAWAANSDEGYRRNPGQEARARAPAVHRAAAPAADRAGDPVPGTLAEAALREKTYKAELARLEYEERSGKLLPADEVKLRWQGIVTLARTKVLGLPAKIQQRLQHLEPADVAIIEELVRETLEELADSATA